VPLVGYCHWSFMDNFEWKLGYAQRFGLVHVDYETQRRTIKASGRYYGRIARANALVEPER
jgi:beta-glucosidase